jgi:hypothetical protein
VKWEKFPFRSIIVNILASTATPFKAFSPSGKAAQAPAQAPAAAPAAQGPSLFDSMTSGMTDVVTYQARPLMAITGASAGVSAGVGLAQVMLKTLPVEAAVPGLVLAGCVGLGAAVVGGKVAWDIGPSLVGSALQQSESLAAKLHLPKGSGKLAASAAFLGSVGSSIGAGGALGVMGGLATAATAVALGVGAATGAVTHHHAQKSAAQA